MDPPPIDVLPDDILYLIVSNHVRDPKDLGACLLAWRRFHMLVPADLTIRRCRFATLLSLCAAGDLDGLQYAASRPEVFGPVAGFRWDACLYVAVVGDRVDILDHIKGRIVAMASSEKSTMPDGQEATLLDKLGCIHSVSQNPTAGAPTWPLMPAPWLALAVAAARCGMDGSLTWLCAEGNRPSRVISVEAIASARKMFGKTARQGAWLLWPRLRLDIGVALKSMWAAQNMTVDEMRAVAERISVASGLDIVGLFQRSIALGGGADDSRVPWAAASAPPDIGRCGEQKASDDAVAREAMADPSSASDDALEAIWRVALHGGLPGLRAQHGDDAVAAALKRCADYPAMFAKFAFQWLESMSSDCPSLDSLSINLPWPSARDDIVWLYRHGKSHEASSNATIFASIAPTLAIVMALAGRRDLMAELGDDPQSADRVAPASEPASGDPLTEEESLYLPVAATAYARGDMDIARWACVRMGPDDPRWAWKAWREGHADVARFLYAHGCARAPLTTGKDDMLPSEEPSKSPLYASLCSRDAEAVALLLDPTAADDSCRGPSTRPFLPLLRWPPTRPWPRAT